MSKRWIVSLAGVLFAANFAFAQAAQPPKGDPTEPPKKPAAKPPDTPPTKGAEKQPLIKDKEPQAEELPLPAEANRKPTGSPTPLLSDLPAFLGVGESGRGVVTADFDYMLFFQRSSLGSFPLATSTLPGSAFVENFDNRGNLITSGGRFALAYSMVEDNQWIPEGIRCVGVEARFLFLGDRSININTDVPATLFRPFFDVNTRTFTGFLIGEPGVATGSLNAHAQTSLWGTEANVWKSMHYDTPGTIWAFSAMAGFRYLNLNSNLDITSNTQFAAAPTDPTFAGLAGNRLVVIDQFGTRNNFYGAQVGIGIKSWFEDHINAEFSLRAAIGNTSESLTIDGFQQRTPPGGATTVTNGGLLALPSNIGTYHVNKFTQVPEVDYKLNFPLCSYATFSTGFSALYWNRTLRAVDQLDHTIDVSQLANFPPGAGSTPTGLGRPAIPFRQSELWILGISVGVQFCW